MSLPTPTIHVLVTALRKEIPSILPGTSTLALSFLYQRQPLHHSPVHEPP